MRAALPRLVRRRCCAQTVRSRRPHEIALVEGRGELLQFQNDITRVVISEPKVADAVVVSPREVMVNAKGRAAPRWWSGRPARSRRATKSRSPRTCRNGTLSASRCWRARTAARSR